MLETEMIVTRELDFNIDDRNRVRWRVVPNGEQGISCLFEDAQGAERFIKNYAKMMGIPIKMESEKGGGLSE